MGMKQDREYQDLWLDEVLHFQNTNQPKLNIVSLNKLKRHYLLEYINLYNT